MVGPPDEAIGLVTRAEELLRRLRALLDEASSAGEPHVAGSEAAVDPSFWPEPPPPVTFADGTWLGRSIDDAFELELRMDLSLSRRLSGDLYRRSRAGRRWFASFSTPPAVPLLPASASWGITFTRASEREIAEPAGSGTLALSKDSEAASSAAEGDWAGAALGTILAADALPGFPTGVTVTFRLGWQRPTLRSLRICRHVPTTGATPRSTGRAEALRLTVGTRLETAGLRVEDLATGSFKVPRQPPSQVELLAAGLESATACRLHGRSADLIVVEATGTARPGLEAIRFPGHAALPEPVLAVSQPRAGPRSKIKLHTELQGIAESLGLVRRDTAEAWSPHSVSAMGSPGTYHRGHAAYWRRFDGQFDAAELAFLRHAPLPLLGDIGRKAAFGSPEIGLRARDAVPYPAPLGGAAYWEEWPGMPRPGPFLPTGAVELHLAGPSSGRMIYLGQPLFLEFHLLNAGEETLSLDPVVLDPKTGRVSLIARRVGWSRVQALERHFRPVVRRTYGAARGPITIPGGEASESVNVQVGYGTDGPFFPEPRVYQIHVTIDLVEADGVRRMSSAPLCFRVEEPHGREDTEEVLRLLEPDAGFWLALGGFEALSTTGTSLLGIAEQRAGRRQDDGLVAAIRRAAAIDAGRFYSTRSTAAIEAGLERCVEMFDMLARNDGLRNFDKTTTRETKQLRHKQAQRLEEALRKMNAFQHSKRKPRRQPTRAKSSS